MNVICICLDTFRADIVGPNQKMSFIETPNMDAFAAESVVFERAFGECQPTLQTRRGLFTGRRTFPWRYNFDRRGHWHHAPGWHKIPPEQDTLAEILVANGYMTGLVADTYHMFKPTMNYTRGFVTYDFIRGQESDNWRFGTREAIEDLLRPHVREPINWDRHVGLMQYMFNQKFRQREEDYSCARVFRRAADWLSENARNAPFFLWIDSFDPHEPWDPPREYADRYRPDWDGKDFITPGAGNEGDGVSDAERERIKALYFGEVTLVDRWVGHLLDRVDESGFERRYDCDVDVRPRHAGTGSRAIWQGTRSPASVQYAIELDGAASRCVQAGFGFCAGARFVAHGVGSCWIFPARRWMEQMCGRW